MMIKYRKRAFIGVIFTLLVVSYVLIWLKYAVPNLGEIQRPRLLSLTAIKAVETSVHAEKNEMPPNVSSPSNGEVMDTDVGEQVRSVLGIGLVNLEEDVLRMDIRKIVRKIGGTAGKETLMYSRLLAKLQGAHTQHAERCVIRVAIQCGQHCRRFQQMVGSNQDPFSCSPSLPFPCDIERQFMVNMTFDILSISDVVIFGVDALKGSLHIDELIAKRPQGQLWAFMTQESPKYLNTFVTTTLGAENPYNLSMAHVHDSDLYSPYWNFQKQPVSRIRPLQNKTKLMAWMASHCSTTAWRRLEFVKFLKTYLDIDTYGKCGELDNVPIKNTLSVLQEYKFYLALENSECREYITEKVSRNSFGSGAVPIVFGSRSEDYARMLPADSYIDLQQFDSIGDFADFIQALDNDVQRYNKYFSWWETGKIRAYSTMRFLESYPEVNLCYIMRKLVHLSLHPETAWQKRAPDFGKWLRGRCLTEGPRKLLGFDIHAP